MKKTRRNLDFEHLETVAHILKTISHPVRLQVLEILEEEEPLTVSVIREKLTIKVEQSMLSHHLIKMKENGILKSTKEGKHIFYRIHDRQILKIFDCMENCNF